MRYYHGIFEPLHYDYGTTTWSVNHIPLFNAILSVCDHRRLVCLVKSSGFVKPVEKLEIFWKIHNISFYALMKILTRGKIRRDQAQAMFEILDIDLTGDLGLSEVSLLVAIIIAQKDNLEREFLYMNAWKMWVFFNVSGMSRMDTRSFKKAGLFFDFSFPTVYHVFRDYNWDDERQMEFDRFRFYLMSCIHFRQVKLFQAKYLRYRQFKSAVLQLLKNILTRVLVEKVFPAPPTILKAISTIKLPPIEGMDKSKRWYDLFDFTNIRMAIQRKWILLKLLLWTRIEESNTVRCCCSCITCGFLCCQPEPEEECCGSCMDGNGCPSFCIYLCPGCRHRKPGKSFKPFLAQESMKLPKKVKPVRASKLNKNTRKEQKKLKLKDVSVIPEVEWRPLGRPRCGIQ